MKWFRGIFCLKDYNTKSIPKRNDFFNDDRYIKNYITSEKFEVLSINSDSGLLDKNRFTVNTYKNLKVIGDIRIDNRTDLIKDYLNPNKIYTDEDIVLILFEIFNKNCFSKLVGEFAFVIWDEVSNILYAVRDQIGVKSLFWIKQNNYLVFASDIFLLQSFFNQSNINRMYFKDFLNWNGNIDSSNTPYKEVNRVSSSTYIEVNENGEVKENRYWNLYDNEKKIKYDSIKDYDEHFVSILNKAVDARTSKDEINSVMLSGGLDSTSIFSITKRLGTPNVLPVCGVFNEFNECDEREYISPLLSMYDAEPIFEVSDEHLTYKNFPNDSPWTFEPNVNSATYLFTKSILQKAKDNGASTILTGYAGDHFLTGAMVSLSDLVKKMKYQTFIKELYSLSKDSRTSIFQVGWKYGISPIVSSNWLKEFGVENNNFIMEQLQKIKSINQKEVYCQLNGTKSHIYTDREIGKDVNIDCNHPFLDRRLIEFLYNVPGEYRWGNGQSKMFIRRGLRTHLPENIIRRIDKTGHLPLTYNGLRDNWTQLNNCFSQARIAEMGLIDKTDWLNTLNDWRQGKQVREDIWLLLTLEIWLYKFEKKFDLVLVS